MKKLIHVLVMLFLMPVVFAQNHKQVNYVPAGVSLDSLYKSQTPFECRVYQLKNQYRQTKIMLVFVTAGSNVHISRKQLRVNYLFKREKTYLRNVFFADVNMLEQHNSIIDVYSFLQRMEEKYDHPEVWAVLSTDAFFGANAKR